MYGTLQIVWLYINIYPIIRGLVFKKGHTRTHARTHTHTHNGICNSIPLR